MGYGDDRNLETINNVMNAISYGQEYDIRTRYMLRTTEQNTIQYRKCFLENVKQQKQE